jgi:4-amino-4-deoxy-L-arabinose transferase-like glycosyltransferase
MSALTLSTIERRLIWMFLGVLLALRIAMIFEVPLTDTTEARYAEIARKMVETGDWVTPQYDYGVPFWAKPPLSTWVSAAGILLFGENEFGARVFILGTALGILLLVHQWMKRWRGGGHALVGTAVLASTAMFFIAAAVVMTDLVMIAGTTLSMVAFWNAMRSESRRRLWGHLFFAGLAVGMLAKGPVAVVLTALPIGAWVLVRNQWRATWRQVPWVTGALLALGLTAPWYVLAELRTPGFLHYFLYGEHLQRFLVSGWRGDLYGNAHSEPTGMIWLYWLASAMPWSFVLLAAMFRPLRAARAVFRSSDDLPFYLLLWLLAPLVFFTTAHNIIPTYAMTGLPAGAVLVPELRGLLRSRTPDGIRAGRWIVGGCSAMALALFTAALVVFTVYPDRAPKRSQKPVVCDALGVDPGARLHYWNRRYYSAEFYSGGKARPLRTEDDLRALLGNGRRDFLALYPAEREALPSWFVRSFEPVSIHQRTLLLMETQPPAKVALNVTK